jgi:tetratricopeptide (TPR) repeat protein
MIGQQWCRSIIMTHTANTKEVIWRIAERGSPFPGLEPYDPLHADVFFGREREIGRGRERLLAASAGGTAFLLVIGPSGAGKSSLVRAGLVPRLTRAGDIRGVDVVRVAVMRPGEAATPQRALAEALFQTGALPELVESDFPNPERLGPALMSEATTAAASILGSLEQMAARLKAEKRDDRSGEVRLLLIIDPLDELPSGVTGARFVLLIAALARSGRVLVIATMRSSSYEALTGEPELVALKDAGATLDLGVPGTEVLAEIVRRPAAAAGLVFDQRRGQSLDDVLLTAAGGKADALPLLGFTLRRLFENRDGDRLTFKAYDQLGGLAGSISRAAERAFASVDKKAQEPLPQLLRGLAEVSRRGTGIDLRDLPLRAAPEGTPVRRLVDALIAPGILLINDERPKPMLRLAHDAVLRDWKRADDIIIKREDYNSPLPVADASTSKQQRRPRHVFAIATVFAQLAIVTTGAGIFAWRQQQIAEHERTNTTAENVGAEHPSKEPSNTELREAYLSLIKVGDALVAQGGLPGALATYRQSLDIVRKLAAKEPDNAVLQHNMFVSLIKVGETLLAQGDRPGALAAYNESLEIARTLAVKDPANTQWQTDVVLSLWRLASAGDDPRGRWTDALELLTRLKSQNHLTPEQEGWISNIEGEIAKVPQAERQ